MLAASMAVATVFCTLPIVAKAACELFPRFTPTSGRTSNQAWEADQFVESIGVNLHIGSGRYASEFYSKVKPRLLESGIRVARTSFTGLFYNPEQIRELGQAGVRFTLATGKETNVDRIVGAIKSVGPQYILAVEGYNEPESRHGCGLGDKCWVQPTREHQALLYNTMNSDAVTRGILVLGPGLKGVTLDYAPQMLGSIDSIMDGNNMHRYPGANNNPERSGARGSFLDKLANYLRYVGNPNKPSFLTETGYSTNAFGSSEAADAVYMPRMYLYNFDHGLAVTSKYELLDESAQSGGGDFQGNFGYIRTNNTPKPSFTAVKNLIALLSDRGGRFAPATLDYRVGGNAGNVYKVLMQKRDGTFYLALWVAQPMQSVAPQAVSVSVPSSINDAAVARPNDGTAWRGLPVSGGQVNLIVDEEVSILRLGGSIPRREGC